MPIVWQSHHRLGVEVAEIIQALSICYSVQRSRTNHPQIPSQVQQQQQQQVEADGLKFTESFQKLNQEPTNCKQQKVPSCFKKPCNLLYIESHTKNWSCYIYFHGIILSFWFPPFLFHTKKHEKNPWAFVWSVWFPHLDGDHKNTASRDSHRLGFPAGGGGVGGPQKNMVFNCPFLVFPGIYYKKVQQF